MNIIFQIDHEGNTRKELYAYAGNNLVELDFAQFGILYTGQNAFVVNQPGHVDVILKSFGNEIARRTFAYHIDTHNSAKLTNPSAVKNWVLTYDSVDEFKTEMNDVHTSMGTGNIVLTSNLSYGGSSYASATYSRNGSPEPEYPIITSN